MISYLYAHILNTTGCFVFCVYKYNWDDMFDIYKWKEWLGKGTGELSNVWALHLLTCIPWALRCWSVRGWEFAPRPLPQECTLCPGRKIHCGWLFTGVTRVIKNALKVLDCRVSKGLCTGSRRIFGKFLIKLKYSLKHFYKFHFAHTLTVCEGCHS